jgi:polysaccharide export outer membrane protein
VKIAGISARLQAVGEKLLYAGMVRSQLVRGGDEHPVITVFRGAHPEQAEDGANDQTTLMPGDVLEVAARTVSHDKK